MYIDSFSVDDEMSVLISFFLLLESVSCHIIKISVDYSRSFRHGLVTS